MKPTNLEGRLRNLERDIPGQKPLRALFEAVSNAYYSILDRLKQAQGGSVEIILHRKADRRRPSLKGVKSHPKVSDIEIVDNGVGFTDDRYGAFDECDTLYNHDRGGRGVGRLVYLMAFNHVEVESHFKLKSQWICRKFQFGIDVPEYVSKPIDEPSTLKQYRTSVKLCGLRNRDDPSLPKTDEVLADRLITHWMHKFVRRQLPAIVVKEVGSTNGVTLQDRFQSAFLISSQSEVVVIKGQQFSVEHVRLHPKRAGHNEILLCVDGRVVEEMTCRGMLAARELVEPRSQSPFVYKAYVEGEYLVNNMDTLRSRFKIATSPKELGPLGSEDLITYRDIQQEVHAAARKSLRSVLNPLHKKLWQRIQDLVATSAPQYRYLLARHRKAILDRMSPEMSNDQIDAVLHRMDLRIAGRLRKQAGQIRTSISKGDYETIHAKFSKFVVEENRRGIDRLAAYVIHRRTILEMLSLAIRRREGGGAQAERVIHEVFAPIQTISEDMRSEQLNLWIVDERLAFHRFLSSDRTLVKAEKSKGQKGARPDIAIFDNPASYSGDDGPYENIVIVEFKQPFRTAYSDEAPIEQIQRYIDDIVDGKAINPRTTRPISLKPNHRFFVYVICDMTAGIRKNLKSHDFMDTADGEGKWQYLSNYKAYVEIIPFEKLVRDAEKRNQAFFDNLDLLSLSKTP